LFREIEKSIVEFPMLGTDLKASLRLRGMQHCATIRNLIDFRDSNIPKLMKYVDLYVFLSF